MRHDLRPRPSLGWLCEAADSATGGNMVDFRPAALLAFADAAAGGVEESSRTVAGVDSVEGFSADCLRAMVETAVDHLRHVSDFLGPQSPADIVALALPMLPFFLYFSSENDCWSLSWLCTTV